MKILICGWCQNKSIVLSYCICRIRTGWQSFNTRTIGRSSVCRNPLLHTVWLRQLFLHALLLETFFVVMPDAADFRA
ncbi:hypothetical protein XU19_12555 [Vibrio parahaemolyticus]|nr:hypothetical protein XU19_12555 [Vibrio parahaemolyticus]KKY42275.1 hypothetical protein AAY51_15135 [Vibrio parahaemolyticus]KOP95064.1 hypothetical protein AL012_14980 [Citrobacter amalonaticus]KOP97219.1 hypothetical protein ALC61_11000 [Citrobacter amalonaticus]